MNVTIQYMGRKSSE